VPITISYHESHRGAGANPFEEEVVMKFCKVSLFFVLLMVLCVPAIAQTEMRFDIPFNFFAADQFLPAGHYTVKRVFQDANIVWYMYNEHASVMMLTHAVETPQKAHQTSLLFFQAGGTYSLVQLWPTGYSGRQVPRSKVKEIVVAEKDKYIEIGTQ
jgi:hypothetical protein